MKKNILLIVAIALVGTVTLALNNLRAQDTPPPGAPPAGQAPLPGSRPLPPAGFRGRPGNSYRQAIFFLQRAKMDLQQSKEDYNGHRQTAMEAVDKALQELQAVQTSIQAAAKTAVPPPAAQPAPPPAPAAPVAPPQ